MMGIDGAQRHTVCLYDEACSNIYYCMRLPDPWPQVAAREGSPMISTASRPRLERTMRTPTPSDNFSKTASLSDSLVADRIERREFIRRVIVAGVGVAGLAASSELASAQQFDDPEAWRYQVKGFVNTVFDPRRARDINSQIQDISMGRAPAASDIHSAYSAPWTRSGLTARPQSSATSTRGIVTWPSLPTATCTIAAT